MILYFFEYPEVFCPVHNVDGIASPAEPSTSANAVKVRLSVSPVRVVMLGQVTVHHQIHLKHHQSCIIPLPPACVSLSKELSIMAHWVK